MRTFARAGAILGALATMLFAAPAAADDCMRPTDPGGADGFDYGTATVKTFGSATVLVWYVTDGPHAVNPATTRGDSVPDDVAEVAQVTTDALASYASMGFRPPVSDSICTDGGGDARLDIYLVHMTGADGTTVLEDPCTPSGAALACPAFVLAHANYAELYPTSSIGIHTVLPHETFHAIQDAYDANLDRFWAEGSAQWAAKQLDPSLTDLESFLPAFFDQPERALDSPANGVTAAFLYGSAIWPVFLAERHGDDIVHAILDSEGKDGKTAIAAADAVLKTMQASIATEYPLFSAWNAATGTRAGSDGYADASTYPLLDLTELDGETAIGTTSGLSSRFFHLTTSGSTLIDLDTDAMRNAGVVVPLVDGVARVDQVATLPATLPAGEAIVIVGGITEKKSDAPFELTATPDASAGGDGGCCSTGTSPSSVWPAAFVLLAIRRRARGRDRTHASRTRR